MDGFGAFGELPFGALREADSNASAGVVQALIELAGVEGVAYIVELYPFQRPPS